MGFLHLAFAVFLAVPGSTQDDAEAAALRWARQLEEEMRLGDPCPSIDPLFDLKALADRTLEGLEGLEKARPGYRQDLLENFALDKEILKSSRERDGYRLVRVRVVDGRPRPIFRMLGSNGFNYHEYFLERTPKGDVRIVDLYVHLTGELLSGTYRRLFLAQAGRDQELLDLLNEPLRKEAERAAKLSGFLKSAARAEAKEAFRLYEELPESLRKEWAVLAAIHGVGLRGGADAAIRAIEIVRSVSPGTTFTAMRSITPYYSTKKYERVLEALDDLTRGIGQDGYIEFQRGTVLARLVRDGEASEAFQLGVKLDGRIPEPRWGLISLTLRRRDFAETARLLTGIEKELGIPLSDLTGNPPYADFVKSEEYAAWMKSRRSSDTRKHDLSVLGATPEGQLMEFVRLSRMNGRFRMEPPGGQPRESTNEEGFSFRGIQELLPDDGAPEGRPRRIRFQKAARRENGRTKLTPIHGKTVIVRGDRDGERTFAYENGDALEGAALEAARDALSDDGEEDDEVGKVFMPPGPMRVGESWTPDIRELVRKLGPGTETFDVESATCRFTLKDVKKREGTEYAEISGLMRFGVKEFQGVQFDAPIPFTGRFTGEVALEGESPETRLDVFLDMSGKRKATFKGSDTPLDITVSLTGKITERKRLIE